MEFSIYASFFSYFYLSTFRFPSNSFSFWQSTNPNLILLGLSVGPVTDATDAKQVKLARWSTNGYVSRSPESSKHVEHQGFGNEGRCLKMECLCLCKVDLIWLDRNLRHWSRQEWWNKVGWRCGWVRTLRQAPQTPHTIVRASGLQNTAR